jgi:hypothetical protein
MNGMNADAGAPSSSIADRRRGCPLARARTIMRMHVTRALKLLRVRPSLRRAVRLVGALALCTTDAARAAPLSTFVRCF